jgi:hypothetical protein
MDPAGVVTRDDPPPSGWFVRLLISAFEAAFGVVIALFAVLMLSFCDGSYAGTDACDGTPLDLLVFALVLMVFGLVAVVGATASLVVPALDRRRILYRGPAIGLLVAAAIISVVAF